MRYSKQTQDTFEEALQYFELLKKKSSVTKIEHRRLFISCRRFSDLFARWSSCSPAEAKAYQVYVSSTPLGEVLQIPQSEWLLWIEEAVSTQDPP